MVAGMGASASGRLVGLCAVIAIGIVAAGPAGAQTPQQLAWCSGGKDSPGPDQKIAACTAVIQSGRYSGKSLALAFNNRANGYLKKEDQDRAIADYDQALKLDPNYALAYNNRGKIYFLKKNYDRAIEPAPTSTTTAATSISPRRTMPARSPTTTAPSRSIPRTR
jgi:hypothetical protein